MKALDLFARRHSLPVYTYSPEPRPSMLALIMLTELRYESFRPNYIRVAQDASAFPEPLQLAIHIGAFVILQSLPQTSHVVLAVEIFVAIYIIWTSMHLLLRYKTSPPLFGPLYHAESLSGFWSGTWHACFASPCQNLAYNPIRRTLPMIGIPVALARSLGVLGAFSLMGAFHVYALAPILSRSGLVRIWWFFFFNGVATVAEALLWGRKRHWAKTVLGWTFQALVSAWTIQATEIPHGLSQVAWRDICGSPSNCLTLDRD